jgi:hypothetical protein
VDAIEIQGELQCEEEFRPSRNWEMEGDFCFHIRQPKVRTCSGRLLTEQDGRRSRKGGVYKPATLALESGPEDSRSSVSAKTKGKRSPHSARSSVSEDVIMKEALSAPKTIPASPSASLASRPKHPIGVPTQNSSEALQGTTGQSVLVEKLVDVIEEIGREASESKKTVVHVQAQLYFKCRFRSYDGAEPFLRYFASQILERLHPDWNGSDFAKGLNDWISHGPPEVPELIDTLPRLLIRRGSQASRSSAAAGPSTPKPLATERTRSKGLKNMPPPSIGRSGKGGLRLAGHPGKRYREIPSDHEDEDNSSDRGKKARTSHYFASTDDDDSDASISTHQSVPTKAYASPTTSARGQAQGVVIKAFVTPSLDPTGPNGTWRCEVGGCGYIVRCADEPDGRDEARRHVQDHESQDSRIELALAESTKGHNPIKYVFSIYSCWPSAKTGIIASVFCSQTWRRSDGFTCT